MMQSAMVAAIVAVGGRASPLFGQVPARRRRSDQSRSIRT
jgi:hypothetical protein